MSAWAFFGSALLHAQSSAETVDSASAAGCRRRAALVAARTPSSTLLKAYSGLSVCPVAGVPVLAAQWAKPITAYNELDALSWVSSQIFDQRLRVAAVAVASNAAESTPRRIAALSVLHSYAMRSVNLLSVSIIMTIPPIAADEVFDAVGSMKTFGDEPLQRETLLPELLGVVLPLIDHPDERLARVARWILYRFERDYPGTLRPTRPVFVRTGGCATRWILRNEEPFEVVVDVAVDGTDEHWQAGMNRRDWRQVASLTTFFTRNTGRVRISLNGQEVSTATATGGPCVDLR